MRKTWSAAGNGVGDGDGTGVGDGVELGVGLGVAAGVEPEDALLAPAPPQPARININENSAQNTSFGPMGEGLLGTAGLNRCS
jgi:hypothetical protein